MQQYLSHTTPQTEAIPGREAEMVKNSARGVAFALDDAARLQRFLILGSSSNLYAPARVLTNESLDVVERMLNDGKGRAVVDAITAISKAGRAASNDPALLALARCAAADDQETRRYALSVLPDVARTGTHLLHFVSYAKQFRGWGRAYRRAVASWLNDRQDRSLAYQLLKYKSRDGYSQRDLLRLAHPKAGNDTYNRLFQWVVNGWDAVGDDPPTDEALQLIWAFERAKCASTERELASDMS